MAIPRVYSKLRKEFGSPAVFSDQPAKLLLDVHPDPNLEAKFIQKTHRDMASQASPVMSEHQINTECFETTSGGINNDIEQTTHSKKKIENNEGYRNSITQLGTVTEDCTKQNNTIDTSQQYFEEEEVVEEIQEPPSAKTVTVFRDPNELKRTITGLSWHPDGGWKLAAAYSCLEFQKTSKTMSLDSYIWDVENPNHPETTLKPASLLVCLDYNPKDSHTLVGGSYNGQITYWDTRKGSQPVEYSSLEHSHRDPVYKIIWLQSKTGTDVFSASIDGQVLWWDVRKLSEPTDRLVLDPSREGNLDQALGATSLEFEATMPTKFMVGTEQGLVVSCNRKAKSPAEKIVCTYESHHGPVYALQRNPFFPKNFLTVGDWTAQIWSEDIKESSIMCSNYQKSYLMDACWSPVRPSIFFTVKKDGTLDVWDILFEQRDPSLSLKVSDTPLCSLRSQDNGRLVACGSQSGKATLLQVCSGLWTQQKDEKSRVAAMFERETKREKILEARQREIRLKERSRSEQSKVDETRREEGEEDAEQLIARAESDFYSLVEAVLRRRQRREEAPQENNVAEEKEAENGVEPGEREEETTEAEK